MWMCIVTNECHVAEIKILLQVIWQQDISAQVGTVVSGPSATANVLFAQVFKVVVQAWTNTI
jgi:hypothetical protein